MYESPVQLYMTDIQTQLIEQQEKQILKAVQSIAVGVSHEELFRALKYDRDQYKKGYADALASIVHCKDCKYRYYHKWDEEFYCKNGCGLADCVKPDDFCPYGERKEN